ncbi:MAG: methyltransferase domain-containing protein [Candidatus Hodarchaeota archaeon]
MEKNQVKRLVREKYAEIANQTNSCGDSTEVTKISQNIGYSAEDIKSVPAGPILGQGCGNPVALSSLKEGEIELDLGSRGGFDVFLAASKVGSSGRVIGVDKTPEMIERARTNAKANNITNVEFRMGEIENLPIAANSVDVVISNCVIFLSPDKLKVFHEIVRVLKPGGRVNISDLVLDDRTPPSLKNTQKTVDRRTFTEYEGIIKASGLKNVKFTVNYPYETENKKILRDYLISVNVQGIKEK